MKRTKNFYPEELDGICVIKREHESTEDLVKRFRKRYNKSGIAKEVRENMYYEKPCIKKRKKRLQAILQKKQDEEKAKTIKEKFLKMKRKKMSERSKRND